MYHRSLCKKTRSNSFTDKKFCSNFCKMLLNHLFINIFKWKAKMQIDIWMCANLTEAKNRMVLHQRPGIVIQTVTLVDQELADISGCHVCWDFHHFTGPILAPHLHYLQTHMWYNKRITVMICTREKEKSCFFASMKKSKACRVSSCFLEFQSAEKRE